MSEQNTFVNGNSCSYATLGHYNVTSAGTMNQARAQATQLGPGGEQQGVYIVPNYHAPGYDTLQHGSAPTCGGFFNINSAYGANANNCNTQFVQRLCSGNAGQ